MRNVCWNLALILCSCLLLSGCGVSVVILKAEQRAALSAVQLDLKVFIEGYYIVGGTMQPLRVNAGVAGATATETDTITVELHRAVSPWDTLDQATAMLSTSGTANFSFSAVSSGSYYIVVKHKNAIATWSGAPVTLMAGSNSYDFSSAATQAYNSNLTQVEAGVWAIYSGDLNQDESVDGSDWTTLETDVIASAFGYLVTDLNGDGSTDNGDVTIWTNNYNNFIFSEHPY